MLEGFTPWSQKISNSYKQKGYWLEETIYGFLQKAARGHREKTAVADSFRELTYAELECEAESMAASFFEKGVRSGQTVVMHLSNSVTFAIAFLGLQRLGAIPVLALSSHREREILHFCRISQASFYILSRDVRTDGCSSMVSAILEGMPGLEVIYVEDMKRGSVSCPRPNPDPSDVALLLTSGGTTGLPKLIPRTHNDYLCFARESARSVRLSKDDVYLVALPAAHNFPLASPGILGALASAATVVFSKSVAPDDAFELIQKYRVTVTSLVPAVARLWADAKDWMPEDLSSLRLIQVGGSRLMPEHSRQLRSAFGSIVQQVYGMAEGLMHLTEIGAPDEVVDNTQGRSLSVDDETRVVGDDGRDVPVGSVGQLLVRGPYTVRGYFRAPEQNKRSFTGDGFYCTGDLVRFTPDGYIVVEGRVKDQINRVGESVSAVEIEELLITHSSIEDAAVIAVPDEMLDERICAFVIIADGYDPVDRLEIRHFLISEGLASFKVPDDVRVLKRFPATAAGKTDKKALLDIYEKTKNAVE